MTDEEIPTDAPLYRCVWKKSKSVTKNLAMELGRATAYGILLIIALAIFVAVIMWVVIPVGIVAIAVGGVIYTFLAAIPQYIYIILAAVLAIPAYSTYWCIARNFTDEDWQHGSTDSITKIFILFVGASLMVLWGLFGAAFGSTIIAQCYYAIHSPLCGTYSGVFAILFGLVGVIVGGVLGSIIGDTIETYLYHRKRVADTSFSRTVEDAKENL